jgi:hypothetical protein
MLGRKDGKYRVNRESLSKTLGSFGKGANAECNGTLITGIKRI